MGLGVLNNLASIQAQNQLTQTSASLQSTLYQLSSGSRINSGADDPAGLQIADQLGANIAALTQSVNNVNNGIGLAQVADGALSQVTNMLNRAITLATEAGQSGLSTSQYTALNTEFQSILNEINQIGNYTTFNGASVFTASTTSVFLSDATASTTISFNVGVLSASALAAGLATDNLNSSASAQTALTDVNTAIQKAAALRGTIGAAVNQMQAAQNVENVQVQNITSAQNAILAANMPQVVSNLSKYLILQQTGVYALGQANSAQQGILRLLQ